MVDRGVTRWSVLGVLLWPDRARWAVLGLLVAASSVLVLTGPLVIRHLVDPRERRRHEWRDAGARRALPRDRPRRAGVGRRRRVAGHDGRVDHHQQPADRHDASSARPRSRVPPSSHPGGVDPACRRRRDVGVGVPRAGRAEGGRRRLDDRRHGRGARRARLAPRGRPGRVPLCHVRHRRAQPAPGGARIERRDGSARQALWRHRGTSRRRRGSPFERRRGPRRVAIRRGQLGGGRGRGATRARLPHDVVVRPTRARRRLGRGPGARCLDGVARSRLGRNDLPPLSIRAADRPPARRPREPARDRAEGERRDGPGARSDGGDLESARRRDHRLQPDH